MRSPYESVTKAAIEDILRQHIKESKFGFILTPEGLQDLVTEFYGFVQTSRAFKSAGDRMLGGAPQPTGRTTTLPR